MQRRMSVYPIELVKCSVSILHRRVPVELDLFDDLHGHRQAAAICLILKMHVKAFLNFLLIGLPMLAFAHSTAIGSTDPVARGKYTS